MSLQEHTAAGQALGYYFQLERAMLWLSKMSVGETVGIETEDDVVSQLINGEKIYEQDKSTTTDVLPFTPSKKDLWKSLNIWLDALNNEEIQLEKSTFYLVTNKKTNGKTLVDQIGDAKSNEETIKCLAEIKTVVGKLTGETKILADKTLSYGDELIKKLIKRVHFDCGTKEYGEGLRTLLISNLQITPTSNEFANPIIDECFGWLFKEVIQKWRNGELAIIERDSLINVKNSAFSRSRELKINENLRSASDITKEEEKIHLDYKYIKQLQILDCSDKDINNAMRDFINTSTKKTEIAKWGIISHKQFENFEDGLFRIWDSKFSKNAIFMKSHTPSEIGYYNFHDVIASEGFIENVKMPPFLVAGTYHQMSDNLKIGWHPNYEELLK
jgi:hypothetical protein